MLVLNVATLRRFLVPGRVFTAKKYDTNFLGSLPLKRIIREDSDNGVPSVISKSNPGIAKAYGDVSFALARHISALKKSNAGKFPKIVIKNT